MKLNLDNSDAQHSIHASGLMNEQNSNRTLEMPPFPLLTWSSVGWEFIDFFASWQGFQVEWPDLPSLRLNREVSTGQVEVTVDIDNNESDVPSPEQAIAYQFLKENEQAVTDAVLQAILNDYSQIQTAWPIDGWDEPIFQLKTASDLRRIIAPRRIHINSEVKDGYAYIGFEMDCLWDIEHGFGIMMHKTQCVGWHEAEGAWNLDIALYDELR